MSIDSDNKENNRFISNLDNLKVMNNEIDNEENEEIEDSFTMIKKAQEKYRTGNESASKNDLSPEEMLRDYNSFDE
jgi:hypothetical protein